MVPFLQIVYFLQPLKKINDVNLRNLIGIFIFNFTIKSNPFWLRFISKVEQGKKFKFLMEHSYFLTFPAGF